MMANNLIPESETYMYIEEPIYRAIYVQKMYYFFFSIKLNPNQVHLNNTNTSHNIRSYRIQNH